MKNLRDNCMAFFQNESIKREIFDFVRPIVKIVYNEIYLYVWFICIYSIFLILITLANMFLLFKILHKTNYFRSELPNI